MPQTDSVSTDRPPLLPADMDPFDWAPSYRIQAVKDSKGLLADLLSNVTCRGLHLLDLPYLDHLPSSLRVLYHLSIARCPELRELPKGLHPRTLSISDCARLRHADIVVEKDATIQCCPVLETVPRLANARRLLLISCPRVHGLPSDMHLRTQLFISKCDSLEEIPPNTVCHGSVSFRSCPSLKRVGDGFRVGTSLSIHDCPNLEYLPDGIKTAGDVSLECPKLRRLPQDLRVGGDLNLIGCNALEGIPSSITVKGEIVYPEHLHPPRY